MENSNLAESMQAMNDSIVANLNKKSLIDKYLDGDPITTSEWEQDRLSYYAADHSYSNLTYEEWFKSKVAEERRWRKDHDQ